MGYVFLYQYFGRAAAIFPGWCGVFEAPPQTPSSHGIPHTHPGNYQEEVKSLLTRLDTLSGSDTLMSEHCNGTESGFLRLWTHLNFVTAYDFTHEAIIRSEL